MFKARPKPVVTKTPSADGQAETQVQTVTLGSRPISPKGNNKVRVGYGPLAWLRQSLAPRRTSARVPTSNFNLLNRLPVIKEGKLIRLGNLSMGAWPVSAGHREWLGEGTNALRA